MIVTFNSVKAAYLLFMFLIYKQKVIASSYEQFMDVFRNDLFDENKECLFGEFISDEHPYEVEDGPFHHGHFIVRFLIKFRSERFTAKIKAYRTIASSVRKYTQTCYVEFHHSNSYENDFSEKLGKNPQIEQNQNSFTFIRLMEDYRWQNHYRATLFGSLRLLTQPTYVIMFYKDKNNVDRIMSKAFLRLIHVILSRMDYYGTRYAIWRSSTLSDTVFFAWTA